jgi:proteasome activator subunit 4
LATIEPLYADGDRFKQRAAAEVIAGILRGSKHWMESDRRKAREWFEQRMDAIFAQIKPDTLSFWEIAFHVCN